MKGSDLTSIISAYVMFFPEHDPEDKTETETGFPKPQSEAVTKEVYRRYLKHTLAPLGLHEEACVRCGDGGC